jgi:RHS repeat-associated protein
VIAEPPDLTVGTSERWRSSLRLVEQFAQAVVPILLLGPTGSGKTTIATQVHRLSGRCGPLVSSSIPAVPPELRHSILQGHVRGAFTGAVSDHPGLLEQAHRGTLFLDEIGLMPAPMQELLLTVLDGQPITRVGDVRSRHVDTRLVVATNSRPQELVQSGVWRPDFSYRLGYFWIELPGLRERIDPINGTVRGMARMRNGTKVKEYSEAPWGDAGADTGIVVRYRLAGREYDQENGLYYMRARYYDPALGRWVSEDPIGIEGGANLFGYSENDPVNRRDPSGLDPGCQPGQGVCLPEIPVVGRWDPFRPGGPLDWLDPGNRCGMDTFHDPECSGYPDQDVLDNYSGVGGSGGDGPGSHPESEGAGPCDAVSRNPTVFAALGAAWQRTLASGAEEGGVLYGHGLGLSGYTNWPNSGSGNSIQLHTPFPIGMFALFHSHPNAGRRGPNAVWLQAPSPRDTALADSVGHQIFVVSRDSFFTYRPGLGTKGCRR